MTIAVITAAALGVGAVASLVRTTPGHPTQLWLVPWATVSTLFAARLLPYNDMAAPTAMLILGGAAAFCGGAVLGERVPSVRRITTERGHVELASIMLLVLTTLGLLAFLAQATSRFGARPALVSSPEVRGAIGAGEMAITVKYVYSALAAAIVSGIAAGRATGARRRFWLAAAAIAAMTTYFSTGRSTPVLALLLASLAFAASTGSRPRILPVAAAGAATAVIAVLALLVGGSLIGKTFANSELTTIQTTFTDRPWLEPMAMPYEYATAPLAALDQIVRHSRGLRSTDGCATFATACTVAGRLGVPITGVPSIRPFTRAPLKWNTYTALDAPLLDGGRSVALVFLVLLGLVAGVASARARVGDVVGLVCWPALGTAALFSPGQNLFFAPHIVGAIVLSLTAIVAAGVVRVRTRRRA